jgi:predicted ATP-dependent serine protease
VSKEEYGAATLTDKVNQFDIKSPNLFFSPDIKGINLSDYKFVFMDSINVLKLTLEDYVKLREQHPETAFIIILQTTKDGKFKGGKDWEHEVEIAVEIIKRQPRVYKNRYGIITPQD